MCLSAQISPEPLDLWSQIVACVMYSSNERFLRKFLLENPKKKKKFNEFFFQNFFGLKIFVCKERRKIKIRVWADLSRLKHEFLFSFFPCIRNFFSGNHIDWFVPDLQDISRQIRFEYFSLFSYFPYIIHLDVCMDLSLLWSEVTKDR